MARHSTPWGCATGAWPLLIPPKINEILVDSSRQRINIEFLWNAHFVGSNALVLRHLHLSGHHLTKPYPDVPSRLRPACQVPLNVGATQFL